MNCEHCEIEKCGVLNKTECPINKLWQRAKEAQGTLEEDTQPLKEVIVWRN